jgi:nitroimidazol reductase NimA-like FMN-containing flavoprotein (pyridoxamine 5'-phosphate oxidase superfamily)
LDTNLADRVQRIIDANAYIVLGTADERGRPWTSPVFYAPDACRTVYWISSPDVTHSRNIAARPGISIVIFDSRAPVGTGGAWAVYMAATAAQVPPAELDHALAVAPTFARHGGDDITPAEVRPPAPYRLYRATVTEHSVACPRSPGEPCADHGLNHDHRTPVLMG